MQTLEQAALDCAKKITQDEIIQQYLQGVFKMGAEWQKEQSKFTDIHTDNSAVIERLQNELDRYRWHDLRVDKDDLPKVDINVLVLTSNGKCVTSSVYIAKDCKGNIINGKLEWKGSGSFVNSIIAWMPIPTFDEILEDNNDVLMRLNNRVIPTQNGWHYINTNPNDLPEENDEIILMYIDMENNSITRYCKGESVLYAVLDYTDVKWKYIE